MKNFSFTLSPKNNQLRAFLVFITLFILAFLPAMTSAFELAQLDPIKADECGLLGVNCQAKGGIANANTRDIADYFWLVIQAALALVAIITMGFLIYSGYLYIMSRGNEQDAVRAKNGIAYALIGLAIIGLAGWLVNAIINI